MSSTFRTDCTLKTLFATKHCNLTTCNIIFWPCYISPRQQQRTRRSSHKHPHAAWETLQQDSEWHMAYLEYVITVPANIRGLRFMRPNFIARKFYRLRRMWRATSLHASPEEATKWPLERPRLSGGLSFPATAIYLRTALIPNVSDQWAAHCSGGRRCRRGADRKKKKK